MDKYIVEIDRKNIFLDTDGKDKLALSVKADNGYAVFCTEIPLTPYTELDFEQVRKEAYDKGLSDSKNQDTKDFADMYDCGYNEGLKDAWEVAGKICVMDSRTRDEIFREVITTNIIEHNSASEAIEKIQQYEQNQEEIQAGNEIKCDNERYVVLQKYLNDIDEPMAVLFNIKDGKTSVFHLYNGNGAIFEKTGRHFPELVEVLKKMREE